MKEQGRYNLPLHEFLRAIVFGNHKNYSPSDSLVANILDISTPDQKEHFAVSIAVSYILRKGKIGGTDGYIERSEVTECFQYLGFQPRQLDNALSRALAAELIATPQGPMKRKVQERYRVTTVGAYSVDRLLCQFSYIDAVIVDTPITDDAIRSQIRDTDQSPLGDRIDRVKIFVNYLDQCWTAFREEAIQAFDWPARSRILKAEIDALSKKRES